MSSRIRCGLMIVSIDLVGCDVSWYYDCDSSSASNGCSVGNASNGGEGKLGI